MSLHGSEMTLDRLTLLVDASPQAIVVVDSNGVIALANLALAPAKPKGVTIVTGKLTNDTELKWEANTDADIAGYEVVWRDTTAAEWTNRVNVGNVLTYIAPSMSKDNYFFGVRSVDKNGNKSPVVYPRPGR